MKQFTLKNLATLLAAVALLAAAPSSRAALITFDFEASIQDFGFGDILTGSYTFDSDTPDTTPPPNTALGTYPGAVKNLEVAVGPLMASSTADGNLIVNTASNQYQMTPVIPLSGNTVSGNTLTSFGFALVQANLPSDELPLTPPAFGGSFARLDFRSTTVGFVFGEITSLTLAQTVPEPATALLLGLALMIGVMPGVMPGLRAAAPR